jgi:hypothetical protein
MNDEDNGENCRHDSLTISYQFDWDRIDFKKIKKTA